MKSKIKIWHFIILLFALIIMIKCGNIIDLLSLLLLYVRIFISSPKSAFELFDIGLLDYTISVFAVFAVPMLVVMMRNKIKLLHVKLGIVPVIIILLFTMAVLAPIIATSNPKFQYDISNAKLLSPLSAKIIVSLVPNSDTTKSSENNYINEFRSYLPETSGVETYIADNADFADDIILQQGGKSKIIKKDYLTRHNLKPVVGNSLFLLGTDEFSRDIFSRIVYGTRLSLFIGVASVMISLVVGLTLGFLSGFIGGITDTILNRTTEMFLAFPMIFLIILIISLFGNSMLVIVMVLGLSGWMSLFKIIRGEVITLKEKEFVITSQMLGYSKSGILIKEMLPLLMAPIVVNLVLQFGNVIIAESALSYLGLGLGHNYASWGSMIEAGQYYLTKAWWMSFSPCLFLVLTVICFNILGKKLESYLDPRLSK